jgi:hypothetical protein
MNQFNTEIEAILRGRRSYKHVASREFVEACKNTKNTRI